MKKKILFLFIAFAFIFIGTYDVDASTTITQASVEEALASPNTEVNKLTCNTNGSTCQLANGEDYIINGNITSTILFMVGEDTTITLNNSTIDARFDYTPYRASVLTLKGNGTINGTFITHGGGFECDGNIVFNNTVTLMSTYFADVSTIKKGTFNKKVSVTYADLTINGGTFNKGLVLINTDSYVNGGTFSYIDDGSETDIITLQNGSLMVIDDGTFSCTGSRTDMNGIRVKSDSELSIHGGTFSNPGKIIRGNDGEGIIIDISGGTFEAGVRVGKFLSGETTLSGGTFKVTGTGSGVGPISTIGDFANLLAPGYMYTASTDDYDADPILDLRVLNVREISVIHEPYDFLEGENQSYDLSSNDPLSFRIDANYSNFSTGGKVYVDNVETNEFTSASGSTIITLNNTLLNTLGAGSHTLKVVFNNGGVAMTSFTLTGTPNTSTNTNNTTLASNPSTGDNIMTYVSIFGLSLIGIVGTGICIKKKVSK